jgi:hypothetical protein
VRDYCPFNPFKRVGYLAILRLEDLRPVERLTVLPEAFFLPVLPLIWAAFFAVTGMALRPLVVPADFRLLILSLAILNYDTFFLTEVPFAALCLYYITDLLPFSANPRCCRLDELLPFAKKNDTRYP